MRFTPLFASVAASLALIGCANVGESAPRAHLLAPQALGAQSAPIAWPADDWWKAFGDTTLDRLIKTALTDNPDLRGAQARVARAQVNAGIAQSALSPQASARAASTRERLSANDIYPPPLGGSTQTLNSATLNASWELDFFGRNRAALGAALGQVRASQAEAQAARSLLASRIATQYFDLARLVAQREVASATRTQREKLRELLADRVKAGLDTNVGLRQAEGAVPQAAQELQAIDADIDLARHALAALLGAGPDATRDLAPPLAQSQAVSVLATLPADLIGHRADIAAARARVEAATLNVSEARGQFYPNIDLSAFAGFSSLGLAQWLQFGSRTYGIGPALSLPIFEGGRLRANLRGREADTDAAIESYNATLVNAVREVADAVTQIQSIERRRVLQRDATQAAESAFDLATQRYRAGLGNYLTVLTAEINVSAQRRIATDLDGLAFQTQVALARALGGGYVEPVRDASAPQARLEATR